MKNCRTFMGVWMSGKVGRLGANRHSECPHIRHLQPSRPEVSVG